MPITRLTKLFKRIPFAAKLILIACIPQAFIIYLAIQLYHEKGEHLNRINAYKSRIELSADLARLIDNLQEERKFSFDFAITNANHAQLSSQRQKTDYYIDRIKANQTPELYQFTSYTSLDRLGEIRNTIDTAGIGPDVVMHYYSNMIFRLNTLNAIPLVGTRELDSVYNDLVAQKLISEMLTYLGIIRSNIYNVLNTRKYMVETLIGTVGTHDVYNSYEKEFLIKASPDVITQYNQIRKNSALDSTITYIDTLFAHFVFDSAYTAQAWWNVSNRGSDELRNLQQKTWERINEQLKHVQQKEYRAQSNTLVILLLLLWIVAVFVTFTIISITRTLNHLRSTTSKIAKGLTGLAIDTSSHDIIGELAACIKEIDINNKVLAEAAAAIGRGNINVVVKPRSPQDILGNAIAKMKAELQLYREEMEHLVEIRTEELNRSNEDLQQFAHVASHDLKEPLRKISTFSSRLMDEHQGELNERGKFYLGKIQNTSARMARMVEDVLNYSIVNAHDQVFERVDLNVVIEGIKNDLEVTILQKQASIEHDRLPEIFGIPVLIHQLFYNLVINALKFSKENTPPRIFIAHTKPTQEDLQKVRETLAAKFVKIEVRDNGIGFDQQYTDQMFAAFKRLNAKEQYEGTGLGLALCKKIVLRHGGSIEAKGKKGEGAVFSVLLPKF